MLKKAFYMTALGLTLAVSARAQKTPVAAPETQRTELSRTENISAIPGVHLAENPLTAHHYVLEDSLDLYPAQQIFVRAFQEALVNKRPEQKLLILIGEEHDKVTQKVFNAIVLNTIADWQKKQPQDKNLQFVILMENGKEFNASNGLKKYQKSYKKYSPYAQMGLEILLGTVSEHQFSAKFIDASWSPKTAILKKDESTIEAVKKISGRNIRSKINAGSDFGLVIRNHVMFQNLPETNAVFSVGRHHLGAIWALNHEEYIVDQDFLSDLYEHSLMELLEKNKDHYVLPFFLDGTKGLDVYKKAFESYPQSVIFENLDGQHFHYWRRFFHPRENKTARAKQKNHIIELHKAYSGPREFFPMYE